MIDWHEMASHPAVRCLGELIRRQFNLWVGFIGPDGDTIPIGAADVSVDKPICQQLKRYSTPENRDPSQPTCSQSIRNWRARDCKTVTRVKCHAGLSALLFPVRDAQKRPVGKVYMSGYLRRASAHEDHETLTKQLNRLDLSDAVSRADLDDLSKYGRQTEATLEALGNQMVREIEALVGGTDAAPSDSVGLFNDAVNFHGMVARSPAMFNLFETVQKVASSSSTVLVQGENGTGKELVAHAVHEESSRSDQPFRALNCAAVAEDLISSELFGHKKGAFSGAHRDQVGICESADGGTLFLDEISEMNSALQGKFLRFLQEGTFSPVGSNEVKKVDVRVICATNRDLEALVDDGHFRRDLFFRINVVKLEPPPLRQRREDIPLLARHFLSSCTNEQGEGPTDFADDVLEAFTRYDWPGNVRELENEVERLVLMSEPGTEITSEFMPPRIEDSQSEPVFVPSRDMELPEAIERLEKHMILEQLEQTGWNKSQAARNLGVSRRNLIRKVKDYELEKHR